jgi:hypothetical protein
MKTRKLNLADKILKVLAYVLVFLFLGWLGKLLIKSLLK